MINRRKDGFLYAVRQTITPFREQGEEITHFTSIHEEITALRAAHDRINHLAHHDPLTGLPNRLLLMERLTRAIDQARRESDGVTLMFFDLDGFKPVNDLYGHQRGDQLLQQVAARLADLLRETDTLARIGGDEFVLPLPGGMSEEDIRALARRVLYTLNTPFELGDCQLTISASIGGAAGRNMAMTPTPCWVQPTAPCTPRSTPGVGSSDWLTRRTRLPIQHSSLVYSHFRSPRPE